MDQKSRDFFAGLQSAKSDAQFNVLDVRVAFKAAGATLEEVGPSCFTFGGFRVSFNGLNATMWYVSSEQVLCHKLGGVDMFNLLNGVLRAPAPA